jgi:hypothetical protein
MTSTKRPQQALAQGQTALPTWLRWVSGHTLTCSLLALMSVRLAPPVGEWYERLQSQLPLAALLCILHGLTIVLQRRDASRFLLALAALRAVLPWLLLVPLTLGTPAVGGTVPRMLTLGIVGAVVGLAAQPVPDPDGRQGARIGASALTWALTALAGSVLGPAMQHALGSVTGVAVLSGALSGFIGGLGSGWLAAGAWGNASAGEQPPLGAGALVRLGGRWLAGCALLGSFAGLVLPLLAEAPSLWVNVFAPPIAFGGVIGAGGGLLLAWLRGEARERARQRALRGVYGALFGLGLAFLPAEMFGYSYPMTSVLILAGCVGLGAGIGQDAAAGPGGSLWWPVATTMTATVAWTGAYWATAPLWFGPHLVRSWQGLAGFVAALATGVLAALAGGVWGLPLVLLAARAWPRPGGSR